MKIYFSDVFEIDTEVVKNHNAVDIALIADIPLFIDPFLLFNSKKPEHRALHDSMIEYLAFLRKKSALADSIDEGLLKHWFYFSEVKQTYLGFSKEGNQGRGLGRNFAVALQENFHSLFSSFGDEAITESSHLEKLCLVEKGVGRDMISDFTTNLIKKYLLEFTQDFARKFLDSDKCKNFSVSRVKFNYETETWENEKFYLPMYNRDFVLLTPRDILTRDDTWINKGDIYSEFSDIATSIENEELRGKINNYFRGLMPATTKPRKIDIEEAITKTIRQFPVLFDYYIKKKEQDGDRAQDLSSERVALAEAIFIENIKELIPKLLKEQGFEESYIATFEETKNRLNYLKKFIEDNDGHKIFYDKNNAPVKKEETLQLIFRLVWYGTRASVDREPNNGRGPVDYKISKGKADSTLVEFKLATNSQLKRNLANQVAIYEKANETHQSFKCIIYFSESEKSKTLKILNELQLNEDENIILIDASPKDPASKV